MRLGFSTNSIGDTDPLEAIPILRGLGYTSLAITLDHHVLNPFSALLPAEISRWRRALGAAGMACTIETGARHLLDSHHKHEPTLVTAISAGRSQRVDFLMRAIDIAAELSAQCVSLWSGVVRDRADNDSLWDRLVSSLTPVLSHAASRGMPIGFEPEPGMFVDTLARYGQLLNRIEVDSMERSKSLQLTIDIGHMECMGEGPAPDLLCPWIGRLVNVHIDDMQACRHEHLPLGSGDIDFPPILEVLAGCTTALHVELPRQSHRWLETARQSAEFLRRARERPASTSHPASLPLVANYSVPPC
jgi:L-ribulose-5-phosphate 3-epimerase